MAEPLVVVGAGGFGRETVDVADSMRHGDGSPVWQIVGVVDDSPTTRNLDRLKVRGIPFLGTRDSWLASSARAAFAVGIGSPTIRRKIADQFEQAGQRAATLIHPTATLGSRVILGEGAIICAGVRLTTNIRLGRHVHLNPNVTVGHDTNIGDFVSLNPSASISGDVTIESEVLVGVAGVVLNLLTVGSGAVVGGGACVVRDVPAGAIVKGVPAK